VEVCNYVNAPTRKQSGRGKSCHLQIETGGGGWYTFIHYSFSSHKQLIRQIFSYFQNRATAALASRPETTDEKVAIVYVARSLEK
jgi:transcriptional regulator CtsR